jgi:hypothetical protein
MAPTWTDRLQNFDRRWIFLLMALAIVIPLIWPLGLPARPSPPVKAIFYAVEGVPEGSTVFVSVDLDPASTPELEPYFRASIAHLKLRKCKIVLATLWYQAPPLVEKWIRETLEQPMFEGDRVYQRNVDYVWLGYKSGDQAAIAAFGQDLWAAYAGKAADGTPLGDIPMMSGAHRLADFPLVVLVSAGFAGAKEYVQQVGTRYKLPMVAACTAVSTTDLAPYYQAGQLLGLAGGMLATLEYESMVLERIQVAPSSTSGLGTRVRILDVLNVGHLVVILAIVFGNVIYFVGRRRGASS